MFRIEDVRMTDISGIYHIILKNNITPNIEYIVIEYGNDKYEVLESFKKNYFNDLNKRFNDLSLFKTHDGVVLPIYVEWAGGDVEDKPEHHIWKSNLSNLVYATIEGKMKDTSGWTAAILKFRVKDRILNDIILRGIVKLWNKHVRVIILNKYGELHPTPIKFSKQYKEVTRTVEVYNDIMGRKKIEIKIRIPEGLFEDVEELFRRLPVKTVEKILEDTKVEAERIAKEQLEILKTKINEINKQMKEIEVIDIFNDELIIT